MAVTPMDEVFLTKVLTVVQRHLQDPTFDVERLGREVGLSRSQLHRKLRALTNQPPTLLIRSIRLQRAAELLAHKTGIGGRGRLLRRLQQPGVLREVFSRAVRMLAARVRADARSRRCVA